MPAKSKAQQIAMAIAEHQPGKLLKRNRGLRQMSQNQLHDFAATKRKNLPERISKNIQKSKASGKGPGRR
jgi:Protein of unknwon function (DUF3008)